MYLPYAARTRPVATQRKTAKTVTIAVHNAGEKNERRSAVKTRDDVAPKSRAPDTQKRSPTARGVPALEFDRASNSNAVVRKSDRAFTKADTKMVRSLFGHNSDAVLDLIENDDKDGAISMTYRLVFKMLIGMLPKAEHMVERTGTQRGIYAMTNLVNQVREVMADIQALRDRGTMGQSVVDRAIRPAFSDIAMQIVESNARMQRVVEAEDLSDSARRVLRDAIADNQRQLAHYLTEQYKGISSAVIKGLT
jgi:hypothetical protein